MINRKIVQNRFNAASTSYENVAFIQKQSAQKLISILFERFADFYPHSILDLGAGTGYVSELLLPHFSKSAYTLNDMAPKMLERASMKFSHYSQFKFIVADMEFYDFSPHALIISNLALQWVNLENTIKKLYGRSDIIAFSCLLAGTFSEWENIFKKNGLLSPLQKYPHEQALADFLYSLHPSCHYFEVETFEVKFPTAKTFVQYLKDLGANVSHHPISLPALRSIIKTYQQPFDITYKVFFALLQRV